MQLNVGLGSNALRQFEYYSLVFVCLSAPSHKEGFIPLSLKRKSSYSFMVGNLSYGLKPYKVGVHGFTSSKNRNWPANVRFPGSSNF